MRKLLNSPWFVTVLALAAAVAVAVKVWPQRSTFASVRPEAATAPEAAPAPEEGERGPVRQSVAKALKALVIPPGVRDPFALPVRTEAADHEKSAGGPTPEVIERIRLSAIWVQGTAVLLLFDGRVCAPGDTIGRCTIESADIDGAWIRHYEERTYLHVGQELAVKTTVPAAPATLSK